MKKTLRKFSSIIITALAISLCFSILAEAYTIDSSLKPVNTAYDKVDFADLNDGSTQSASSATILILQIFAGALLYFAAPVATILIIVNAFRMVTGGAESDTLEQAKKGLTWTIIGLITIMMSYSIVRIAIEVSINAAANTEAASTNNNSSDSGSGGS